MHRTLGRLDLLKSIKGLAGHCKRDPLAEKIAHILYLLQTNLAAIAEHLSRRFKRGLA